MTHMTPYHWRHFEVQWSAKNRTVYGPVLWQRPIIILSKPDTDVWPKHRYWQAWKRL